MSISFGENRKTFTGNRQMVFEIPMHRKGEGAGGEKYEGPRDKECTSCGKEKLGLLGKAPQSEKGKRTNWGKKRSKGLLVPR